MSTVKRLTVQQKADDFSKDQGIAIHFYSWSRKNGFLKLKFKPIQQIQRAVVFPCESSYNLIWQLHWCFSSHEKPHANWSGFIQDITSSFSNQRKDRRQFLPIMDLIPTDENCIYSTLLFVIVQAKILNVQIPSITFDQPHWLKSTCIIKELNLDTVCRL